MGARRGELLADADLRPAALAVGVVAGAATLQVVVFPGTADTSWLRFAVEILLVPLPLICSFVLTTIRDIQTVWRPLYAGTVLIGVYAVTDALDEVVSQPDAFALVFEDGALLVGAGALVVGTYRWVERKRAYEADLERRNERLDQFASVVSHDLRNPLNVAQMRLELARDGHGTEHLSTVADAHDRMESLIEDVLQLARSGEAVGNTEPVGLATVAADAVANTNLDAAALTVEADVDLQADPGRLTAVFENLFRNALDHGGRDVQVRVGPLEDGFFVEDDGPGIPPEERNRIFESGYSNNPDGTGLGLAIVSGVAEAHGWSVEATAAESGGARFEFRDVTLATELSTSGPRQ
ncbi:putative signal-transducing histidine kinase / two-component system, OmpR family, sensor histidine kinase RstB [Haloferax elongans ATCC BAA-1513]|uniref:histidine kinase n=1 Tax=Haloferax elongans ATCC BAA-1513 TaxID=1230453 RepID=M0HQM1_HALEO|nr:HAMP domain-containing sensor histidine kinase [Haloferax elongans]ELZ86023.1 putative signal-transducing histidine kinase / two-component system, OmpR family, sensor histidine kinase RstB [Haloferax elongans ATCC BAA-1513]